MTTRTKPTEHLTAASLLDEFRAALKAADAPYAELVARTGLASLERAKATPEDKARLRQIAKSLTLDRLEQALFQTLFQNIWLLNGIDPEDRRGTRSAARLALLDECVHQELISLRPQAVLLDLDDDDTTIFGVEVWERTDPGARIQPESPEDEDKYRARLISLLTLINNEDLPPLDRAWLRVYAHGLMLHPARLAAIPRPEWRSYFAAPLPEELAARVQALVDDHERAQDEPKEASAPQDGQTSRRYESFLFGAFMAAYELDALLHGRSVDD